ncbi:MAG TPA: NUDIX domain-containing protein [Anaerolineae bacterium]|nr:NUDIX domain-containing protein [Anaerolineae bacterium]
MTTTPSRPRVGIGVIMTKDQQVLLLRRHNVHGAGTWSTPGGHLDFGESPEQCAVREVKEETGLDIDAVAFRAITNDVFATEGRHYITIWMEGRYVVGDPILAAPYEASEIGWFPWDALPQPLFLSLQNLLDGNCYPYACL